ncbi:MAG: universal stress protein [Gemmatimonadaceae bacterium]
MRLLQLETVLVADDLTATSESALRTAAVLRDGSGASLHVVHVAPGGADIAARSGIRAEFLQSFAENAARARVGTEYTPHVLSGSVTDAIGTLADGISADVIITGRRGRGAVPTDRPLGGTAFSIITSSLVPCLAVSEPMTIPLKRVLVAIDYSEASRGALLVGLSWASALRVRDGGNPLLTALHVHSDDGSSDRARWKREVDHELDILRRAAGDWAGVEVSGMMITADDVVSAITQQAASQDAELLVLGTRGRNPQKDALGSVSAAMLGRVQAPVLLVPPAVWRDYARDMDYL